MNSRPITTKTMFRGSLLLAGIAGGIMQSWLVFLGTLGLGMAANYHSGSNETPKRTR